jgi:hypothetical protein
MTLHSSVFSRRRPSSACGPAFDSLRGRRPRLMECIRKAVCGFILPRQSSSHHAPACSGIDTQVRPSLVDSAQSPLGRWMVEKAPLLDPIPSRLGLGETPAPVARILITGVDLVALTLAPSLLRSARIPTGASILYGWSPLAVKETAGSGRMEAVGLLLLALALATERRGARLASALAYGASLLASVWGAACLPRSYAVWA